MGRGVVLACAAVQLIRYFVVERGVFQSQLTLISGIVCLALGAFLLLRSDINDMHDLVEGDVRFSEQFVMGE